MVGLPRFIMIDLMKRFKKRYILLGILTALGLGYWLLKPGRISQATETHQVSRGTITETIVASGNVKPAGQVSIYSTANGVISEFYVANGDIVVEGQELFRVLSTASPQEQASAQAAYTAAIQARRQISQDKLQVQANLEAARKAILDAQQAVDDLRNDPHGSDDYSIAERESIYSSLTAARQSFARAEKQYLEYDTAIAAKSQEETAKRIAYEATLDQVVIAPVPGTIANIDIGDGEEVSVASKTTAQPVLHLTDFSRYSIDVSIKESDIYRLSLGQTAEVVLDAFDEVSLTGKVERIDTLGLAEQGLVTYTATISLESFDERIRPGMTAKVTIATASKSDVVTIPNQYLRFDDGQTIVYIPARKQPERRVVQIGLKNGQFSEVVDGLEAGEIILNQVQLE